MKKLLLQIQTILIRFRNISIQSASVLALALVALLSACATTPKVNTESKPDTDFSGYHTFALMPLPTTGPASDPGATPRLAEPARKTTVDALTAKGFTESDRAQADLAINLRGKSLPKVQVTDWGYAGMPIYGLRGSYYGYGSYRSAEVHYFEERMLGIEIFDNHTKELVWVGWSSTEANGPIKVEKLQAAIRSILVKFPPTAPASKP